MALAWSLGLLLFFAGLCLEAAAVLLLLGARGVEGPVVRWAAILVMGALSLQISALFVPPVRVTGYWFVLGASSLLLPAPLVARARRLALPVRAADEGNRPEMAASLATEQEYHDQLARIPEVLAAHPGGLTLVEIGEAMGVEWRRLTGAAKELLEQGKLRKEGRRYFVQIESYEEREGPW